MKLVLALALVMSLSGIPVCAQGPIADSVSRAVAQTPQSPSAGPGPNKQMLTAGLAMMGGGLTLAILGATVGKSETCIGGIFAICVEQTNWGLTGTGILVAAAGGLFTGLSFLRNVQTVPGGVMVKRTVKL